MAQTVRLKYFQSLIKLNQTRMRSAKQTIDSAIAMISSYLLTPCLVALITTQQTSVFHFGILFDAVFHPKLASGHLGAAFGVSWCSWADLQAVLGSSWVLLGHSCGSLGSSWDGLGPS